MTRSADAPREPLSTAQRRVLERLVGEEVARRDEPAVAEAYADFRAAMEGLRRDAAPLLAHEEGRDQ
ncbi:hypothetical protein [Sinomonas sp. ASV322]|uniref:hypothetical protein n=1 Tax=Sinomonas sp. ASV322 TaxID=3041920 RepID=UPI0027DC2304|nr:hypothetical protein [Sinomonas sp. ASV322]MDQ4503533.1 hypothetical protein [Sinomonas sp. ASV322]